MTAANEAKRNCARVTERGEDAWSVSREPMDKNRIRGGAEQGERATDRDALVVKAQVACIRRLYGEGSRSYLGRSRLVPERATVRSRSDKSVEVIVAARRRTEREGESIAMLLGTARHQKPGQAGRTFGGEGEARPEAFRDELGLARHEREGSGRADLLGQVLARGNLALPWRRVRPIAAVPGVDGLMVQATAEYF